MTPTRWNLALPTCLLLLAGSWFAASSSAGTACYSERETLIGIPTGSNKVCVIWGCQGCVCTFAGKPQTSTTVPGNHCNVTKMSTSTSDCPPSPACPSGGKKQDMLVTVECCFTIPTGFFDIPLPASLSCVSFTHGFDAGCP